MARSTAGCLLAPFGAKRTVPRFPDLDDSFSGPAPCDELARPWGLASLLVDEAAVELAPRVMARGSHILRTAAMRSLLLMPLSSAGHLYWSL